MSSMGLQLSPVIENKQFDVLSGFRVSPLRKKGEKEVIQGKKAGDQSVNIEVVF